MPPTASKRDTIKEGLEEAREFDTIEIYKGTYREHVVIDKRVNIVAKGGLVTIINDRRTAVVFRGEGLKAELNGGPNHQFHIQTDRKLGHGHAVNAVTVTGKGCAPTIEGCSIQSSSLGGIVVSQGAPRHG